MERVNKNGPFKLISLIQSQSSSDILVMDSILFTPALLTRTSTLSIVSTLLRNCFTDLSLILSNILVIFEIAAVTKKQTQHSS